jgi:6-phosphogluconolactonase
MKQKLISFSDIRGIAEELAERLIRLVADKGHANIAVSGGNTPLVIFENWRDDTRIQWDKISIYWVDERMVPTGSDESNYGNALRIFQQNPAFPLSALHPILSDGSRPSDLAACYSSALIAQQAEAMDLILLGIGEDGHTASIFPGQDELLTCDKLAAASVNPHTKQDRVTLTGKSLLAANKLIFIAIGANKRLMIQQITNPKFAHIYPASYIYLHHRNAVVYADTAAVK